MKEITIHTDGACSGNPGPGGWGAVLNCAGVVQEISGGEPHTTNNRMEMMVAIASLRTLKEPCAVAIYTDSQYVKNGITQWIIGWQKNGWKNAQKQPVKNADLWQELLIETKRHTVSWHWVRGHDGDAGNERADTLARLAVVQHV